LGLGIVGNGHAHVEVFKMQALKLSVAGTGDLSLSSPGTEDVQVNVAVSGGV
jgi:hypothetical protein